MANPAVMEVPRFERRRLLAAEASCRKSGEWGEWETIDFPDGGFSGFAVGGDLGDSLSDSKRSGTKTILNWTRLSMCGNNLPRNVSWPSLRNLVRYSLTIDKYAIFCDFLPSLL